MKKFLPVAFILCLASCKKEDAKNTLTKENLVGTYKQTAENVSGIGSTWNTNYYDACEMDNTTQLKSDNTIAYSDAGEVCNPSMNGTGTWSLNNKTLTIDGEELTVESFDGKTLVVKSTYNFQGTSFTTSATFVKQ